MNRLIHYGSVESIPYYNCSGKTTEEWNATGLSRPLLGWPILIFGIFIELLYIPIIYIIFKTKLIRHACYKIILLLACADMLATVNSCIITGFLLIYGAVFCSFQTFIYVVGSMAVGAWCLSCGTVVALFLNRVISVAFQQYSDIIEKKLAYASMVICVIYWIYALIFAPSGCYNSVIMAWIPDPLVIEPQYQTIEVLDYYRSDLQVWNNWMFVIAMFILFTIYFFLVKRLAEGRNSKASKAIFIQCSIICFFNTTVSIIYNVLPFVYPAEWIMIGCQIAWSINHGCPALIYITLNDTIRKEFRRMVLGEKKISTTISHTTSKH